MSTSIGERVRSTWDRLSPLPGGKRLFSFGIGQMAPYSGSIGALVEDLRPGYAKVSMRDRRKVRNHLDCVHAIALMNLGEISTGLAVISGMPAGARSILAGLSMEYHAKARGRLVAECTTPVLETSERSEYTIVGEIKNADGEIVATATARWLVGPARSKTPAAPGAAAA
jgi:acyl-coenzyme A thioesterase PaaI-like protein